MPLIVETLLIVLTLAAVVLAIACILGGSEF